MTMKNLTPHEIVIVRDGAEALRIAPSGQVARVRMVSVVMDTISAALGVAVCCQRAAEVCGVPPQERDTALIVSAMVRSELPGRTDLFSPGELIRGADGQPTGCRGLVASAVARTAAIQVPDGSG